ncbi:hypothetical protein GEMRC1_005063 [Eukaryota sp. GEM-RC1]
MNSLESEYSRAQDEFLKAESKRTQQLRSIDDSIQKQEELILKAQQRLKQLLEFKKSLTYDEDLERKRVLSSQLKANFDEISTEFEKFHLKSDHLRYHSDKLFRQKRVCDDSISFTDQIFRNFLKRSLNQLNVPYDSNSTSVSCLLKIENFKNCKNHFDVLITGCRRPLNLLGFPKLRSFPAAILKMHDGIENSFQLPSKHPDLIESFLKVLDKTLTILLKFQTAADADTSISSVFERFFPDETDSECAVNLFPLFDSMFEQFDDVTNFFIHCSMYNSPLIYSNYLSYLILNSGCPLHSGDHSNSYNQKFLKMLGKCSGCCFVFCFVHFLESFKSFVDFLLSSSFLSLNQQTKARLEPYLKLFDVKFCKLEQQLELRRFELSLKISNIVEEGRFFQISFVSLIRRVPTDDLVDIYFFNDAVLLISPSFNDRYLWIYPNQIKSIAISNPINSHVRLKSSNISVIFDCHSSEIADQLITHVRAVKEHRSR